MGTTPDPALETALAYAARGWCVFPIQAGYKKPPLCSWSLDATSDPDQVREWARKYPGCNWGLAAGPSGLTVVDIDDKPDANGFETLLDLDLEGAELPLTYRVRTPSGGQHLYYAGAAPDTVQKIGPGVDTRGRGGYVLIPGSHVNGDGHKKYYVQEDATPREIAELPDWVRERLEAARTSERDPNRDIPAAELDLEHNIERAREYLTTSAPAAIEGDGGDTTTYTVACQVRELGVSEQTAVDLMLEVYNPRCIPEWSADEIQTKVQNAYRYARRQAAAGTPEAAFEPVEDQGGGTTAEDTETAKEASPEPVVSIFRDDMICAQGLGMVEPPEREWVCEGRGGLARNLVGVIAGQGGCGKTLFLMQMACSIVSGVDCMSGAPWTFPTRGPVILVLAEDPLDEIERRLHRIRQNAPQDLDLSQLYIIPRRAGLTSLMRRDSGRNLRPTIALADLKAKVKQVQPVLLGLDSLSVLCGEGETDNADGARVMDMLADLCHVGGGTSTTILHHVSKASQAAKGNAGRSKKPVPPAQHLHEALSPDAVRGSSAIVNNARWVMTMTRAPKALHDEVQFDGETLVVGAVRKTNYSAPLNDVWFDNRDGHLVRFHPQDVAEINDQSLMDQIVAYLLQHETSRDEFLRAGRLDLDLSRDRARDLLGRLIDQGRVTYNQTARGKKSMLQVIG